MTKFLVAYEIINTFAVEDYSHIEDRIEADFEFNHKWQKTIWVLQTDIPERKVFEYFAKLVDTTKFKLLVVNLNGSGIWLDPKDRLPDFLHTKEESTGLIL